MRVNGRQLFTLVTGCGLAVIIAGWTFQPAQILVSGGIILATGQEDMPLRQLCIGVAAGVVLVAIWLTLVFRTKKE